MKGRANKFPLFKLVEKNGSGQLKTKDTFLETRKRSSSNKAFSFVNRTMKDAGKEWLYDPSLTHLTH